MDNKTFLKVPFEEKDKAKELGAKWDQENKAWFVPQDLDIAPFEQWLPKQEQELANMSAKEMLVEEEFAQFLQKEAGLDVENPIMDGQIHRASVIGREHAKDGSYCGFLDGKPAGWAKNFVTGETHKFVSEQKLNLSPTDRESLEAERLLKLQAREQERERIQKETAEKSQEIYAFCQEAQTHPYLDKKGIEPIEAKVNELNHLVVAVRNVDNEIRGLHYINEDGAKFYEKGMEKEGNFALLGKDDLSTAKQVLVCEGYATGVSLHMATQLPVAVAFDSGNLEAVALNLKEKNQHNKIYICADNDHELAHRRPDLGNIGLLKADEASRAVGGVLKFPKSKERGISDFNDVHQKHGLGEVRKQLGIVREQDKQIAYDLKKSRSLELSR